MCEPARVNAENIPLPCPVLNPCPPALVSLRSSCVPLLSLAQGQRVLVSAACAGERRVSSYVVSSGGVCFLHSVKWLNVAFLPTYSESFVLALCGYLSCFPSASSHHFQLA